VELSNGNRDAGPTRAKGHGFPGVLEGNLVEDHMPMEVRKETPRAIASDG
jgi:hypothetical protein